MTGKLFAIRLAAAAVFALLITERANAEVMQFDCFAHAKDVTESLYVPHRLWIDTQKSIVMEGRVLPTEASLNYHFKQVPTQQITATSARWRNGADSESLDLKTGALLVTGETAGAQPAEVCVKGTLSFPTSSETNSNTTNDLSGSVGAQASPAPQANMAGGQAQAEILNLRCHQTDPEPGLGYTQYIILWIDFDQRTITWELEDHQLLLPATMQTMPVEITPEAFNYNPMGQNPTGINRQTGTYRTNNTFGQTAAGECVKDSMPFPAGKF